MATCSPIPFVVTTANHGATIWTPDQLGDNSIPYIPNPPFNPISPVWEDLPPNTHLTPGMPELGPPLGANNPGIALWGNGNWWFGSITYGGQILGSGGGGQNVNDPAHHVINHYAGPGATPPNTPFVGYAYSYNNGVLNEYFIIPPCPQAGPYSTKFSYSFSRAISISASGMSTSCSAYKMKNQKHIIFVSKTSPYNIYEFDISSSIGVLTKTITNTFTTFANGGVDKNWGVPLSLVFYDGLPGSEYEEPKILISGYKPDGTISTQSNSAANLRAAYYLLDYDTGDICDSWIGCQIYAPHDGCIDSWDGQSAQGHMYYDQLTGKTRVSSHHPEGNREISFCPLTLHKQTISPLNWVHLGSATQSCQATLPCQNCLGTYIYGCTDSTATNYDPLATNDDGSCIAAVYGCTDPTALNYYAGAQVDDGSCCYTSLVYDPVSNSAVCAGAGCTDPLATNYDPLATPDDGSCTYPPPVNPCNDPWTNTPGLVQTCCDWCEENASIPGGLYGPPPQGCYDWMCDCCKPPTIKTLDLDLSDIPAAGESRTFTITGEGDGEVKFKLEVRDKDTGKYYNFVTNLFQTTEDSLEGTVTGGKYSGNITFPAVTGADDQYDIYLYAKPGTKHAKYSEARFGDNTLDINGSIGSNSLLMQKVIYQYDALTLTFSGFSPNSTVSVHTPGTDTISVGRGQSKAKTAFSFSWTAATTAAYRVLRQPAQSDVLAFVEPVVDATPVNLPGEDIYPAVSNTDTVNGDVTSGTTVRMDTAVASKMKVGDRVTGNAALNATTATVVSLDSTYIFTLSEAVAIADGITLSFSNQMNYSWTVDNFANVIQEGMIIVPATNVTSGTSISTYQDTITIFEDTVDEEIIIQHDQPAVSTLEKKPTVVKGLVTVQEGQITFDKQQVLALGGDTLKIGGYGEAEILRVHDWDVKFTDLAITLTAPTTTTSGAVSASATIGVASKEGIINNVSRIGGVGINSKLQNPLITAGGGATGSGNLTADAAQTLESGITLTVENTSRVATITGNIEIIRAGTSDRTLRFDIEKLLSNSAP